MAHPPIAIQHQPSEQRFEALVDGRVCELSYHLADGVATLHHTAVPRPLEGRGIAAALVSAALAEARCQGWRVRPVCSYVRVYMQRHPETQDLLQTR